ncbi:DUF2269 family protein [Paenibacillus sp. R14(2021)]|uniref:DUF2269 family protein n=1 Tax=Paenibacillus sp. R14(2021) TaxID=2859228 RepID=UPI001C612E21|nr:DUF2269 family protein [Paenibacillus sp. R14(2021)]
MTGWLVVHFIGVLLFLGNIITAAFWKVRAEIGKNPTVIHSTVRNVMVADYVFTVPGLLLIIVSGVSMAVQAKLPMYGLNWLTVSLLLFAVTGLIWLTLLIPLQRAMIRHSAASVEKGAVTSAYRRASRLWDIFGIAATLLPLVILYFMVSKNF